MSGWRIGIVALCLLTLLCAGTSRAKDAGDPLRKFDDYGLIRWKDEKARLDNFAIQLKNNADFIGYIFVNDGEDVCEGEAQARAIRAKRYIVEYRGVPWNRVIWRLEGFTGHFSVTPLAIDRGIQLPAPSPGYQTGPFEHITRNCRQRIAKIRNSRWN